MKYILTTEDGSNYTTDNISEDEKSACDDGYLSIINVVTMTEFIARKWHPMARWETLSDAD